MPTNSRVITEEAIEERLAEISSEIERLEVERDALINLLKKKGVDRRRLVQEEGGQERIFETLEQPQQHFRPSPKTAVKVTVERHPGWKRGQIVDRLEDVVDSDAEDVRAVLYTAMRRLEEEGVVVRKGDKMYPKSHPRVRHNVLSGSDAEGEVKSVVRRSRGKTKRE